LSNASYNSKKLFINAPQNIENMQSTIQVWGQ